MVKKREPYREYSPEFKLEAVRLYEEEGLSYQAIAERVGIPSNTQVKHWVKKHREGEALERSWDFTRKKSWERRGPSKTKFSSIEEERDYLKAEVEYLKKRYPNLHKEPFL